MSWVENVRTLYAYDRWANDKVLAAAAQLSDEELARERLSSYGSLAKDLAHIVSTQQNWFGFIVGEDRPPRWNPPETDVIPTLRQHYDASHERLRSYCERLTDDELMREIAGEWKGEKYSYRPWQILFHLANHGTQHRAEVGIALLPLDASPGDLDAIFFYDEQ